MASVVCKLDSSSVGSIQESLNSSCVVPQTDATVLVSALSNGDEEQVLSALSADSLTNVIMAGLIRDNGLQSPLNRGRFYACHSKENVLEGVALIGHTILFDAFTDRAIQAFAAIARFEPATHLLMGEHINVRRFWSHYSSERQSPRHVCPVLFLRRREPFESLHRVRGLRLARRDDLELVVSAQAAMALETSGVDPLKKDPVGFRERYLRRIEKKRVWVLVRNSRLVFKTDIIADTPQATYIEGVYVSPEQRGKGLGRSCLMTLGKTLFNSTKAIYLFVDEENARTRSFYSDLGFRVAGQYDLLYF
jgi:ribosomal protein S18 acetylase RimI-like enzyme